MRQFTAMAGFPLRVRRSSTECESITIASESITVCDSLCGTIFSMSHLDGPVRFLLHKETLLVFFGFPLFGQNSSLNWRRFDVPSLRLCLCSVTQQATRTNDGLFLLHPGTLGMVCDVVFPQIQVLFFIFYFFKYGSWIVKPVPQNDINWMRNTLAVSESTVTEATLTPAWTNSETLFIRENDFWPKHHFQVVPTQTLKRNTSQIAKSSFPVWILLWETK